MATTDDQQQYWKPGRWWRVIRSAPTRAQGIWCETSSDYEAVAAYHRLDDPTKKLQRMYESAEGWLVEQRWHTVLEDTGIEVGYDDEPETYDDGIHEWFADTQGISIGVLPGQDEPLVSIVMDDGSDRRIEVLVTPDVGLQLAHTIAQMALDQAPPPPTPLALDDGRKGYRR